MPAPDSIRALCLILLRPDREACSSNWSDKFAHPSHVESRARYHTTVLCLLLVMLAHVTAAQRSADPNTEQLIEQLASKNEQSIKVAVDALMKQGPQVIPALVNVLDKRKDSQTQFIASGILRGSTRHIVGSKPRSSRWRGVNVRETPSRISSSSKKRRSRSLAASQDSSASPTWFATPICRLVVAWPSRSRT